MLKLGRVTKVKMLFLVLVFVFNFDLFKFSAAILEKGLFTTSNECVNIFIREVKFDVYGKRQTVNGKLLPSVFSSLYSRIKIFVFAVNSKRHFSIFV